MSHLVKALWDELWFVNMGYTNKIWLIDWLIVWDRLIHCMGQSWVVPVEKLREVVALLFNRGKEINQMFIQQRTS